MRVCACLRSGTLDVASVFYALTLLQLLATYVVDWFSLAIQATAELSVSIRRINDFLAIPETCHTATALEAPPLRNTTSSPEDPIVSADPPVAPVGTVVLQGSDFAWATPEAGAGNAATGVATSGVAASGSGAEHTSGDNSGPPLPTVVVALSAAPGNGTEAPPPKSADVPAADPHGLIGAPAEAAPVLHGLRLRVAPGELLAVAGPTGSGKSSLLAALLGELKPLGPGAAPLLSGRVALCTQIPWIMAGALRDNVLFGLPYDAKWYDAVLHACCLDDDVARLPDGDQTELAEGAANLSGGQRARLALARALYSRPEVALLDDPLSAVDPKVGWALFERALGPCGLMAACGTTRILVTHQHRYLASCDRVLVLCAGRQAALGPWAQLAALGLPEMVPVSAGEQEQGPEPDQEQRRCAPLAAMRDKGGLDQAGRSGPRPQEEAPSRASAVLPPAAAEPSAAVGGEPPRRQPKPRRSLCLDEGRSTPSPVELQRRIRIASATATCGVPGMALLSFSRAHEDACGGADGGEAAVEVPGRGGPAPSGEGGGDAGEEASVETRPKRAAQQLNWTKSGRLVEAEASRVEGVAWTTYGRYAAYLGPVWVAVLAAALVGGQAVYLAADWWLALWANAPAEEQRSSRWLRVYGLLTAGVVLVALFRTALFYAAAVAAASRLHNDMASRVLHAPLSFFHANPSGRVVNRFAKDQGLVDDVLPAFAFDALQCVFMVIGALVLVAVAVPLALPLLVPLAAAFFLTRRRYVTASRQVKRWEAVTYSPVCSAFATTLKGLPVIRAYAAGPRFEERLHSHMADHGAWYFALIACLRWVGLRLDVLAATAVMATAMMAVVVRDSISIEILGLAMSHTLNLALQMQWFVRQSAEVENCMTSVERMLEFATMQPEPDPASSGGASTASVAPAAAEYESHTNAKSGRYGRCCPGAGAKQPNSIELQEQQGAPGVVVCAAAPPDGWPRSGWLRFEDVCAVYRPGLAPCLRGLSFELPPGSSCGVVGRTGSGKSSLMLALFRLIPVTAGRILLDGVDCATLPLRVLRRQLAIIPQDPVLFSGSLRHNMDPWAAHGDAALWEMLDAVRLKAAMGAMAGGLDAPVSGGGANMSAGQRQLLCLARALLAGTRVLALDEATANVDAATDELVHSALRGFTGGGRGEGGRTLLVIAHRLETVMDSDLLLVLAGGELAESGPPRQLLAREGGAFARMVVAARQLEAREGA